jgi:hypothetical protein
MDVYGMYIITHTHIYIHIYIYYVRIFIINGVQTNL